MGAREETEQRQGQLQLALAVSFQQLHLVVVSQLTTSCVNRQLLGSVYGATSCHVHIMAVGQCLVERTKSTAYVSALRRIPLARLILRPPIAVQLPLVRTSQTSASTLALRAGGISEWVSIERALRMPPQYSTRSRLNSCGTALLFLLRPQTWKKCNKPRSSSTLYVSLPSVSSPLSSRTVREAPQNC